MTSKQKILSCILLFGISTIAFSEPSTFEAMQEDGFKWFQPGAVIYGGDTLVGLEICALDEEALVINSSGEQIILHEFSCFYTGAYDIRTSSKNGGVMVKIIHEQL